MQNNEKDQPVIELAFHDQPVAWSEMTSDGVEMLCSEGGDGWELAMHHAICLEQALKNIGSCEAEIVWIDALQEWLGENRSKVRRENAD